MIVYKHTNIISGKCYIGQTVNTMEERWKGHLYDARYNKRRKFLAALNKYGPDTWEHEILFESDDPELISDKEVEYIKLFDSVKSGYNTSHEKYRTNTSHTPESLLNMSIAQKAAHAKKRAEGRAGGWHRCDGGAMLGKKHPGKGKEHKKWDNKGTRTWKLIDGVRVWYNKEAAV